MLKRSQYSGGAALVLALFALLLVTIVVLAFFDQARVNRKISFSSASQARANILALSALDFIKADLIEEIKAGSGDPSLAGGLKGAYEPRVAENMLPYDMVNDLGGSASTSGSIPGNLIKWSSADKAQWKTAGGFSYTGNSRSSATKVLASAPSVNGRYIDRSRWAKPFIPSGELAAGVEPQWMLITRQGPLLGTGATSVEQLTDASDTNPNYVIGRYAFVVYDEGGLLDINAAGYPTAFGDEEGVAGFGNDIARKGNLGLADLGMVTSNTAAINQLIQNMRNRFSAKNSTEYKNYLSGTAAASGFMNTSAGDSAFISRQDFLRAAAHLNATELTPYFTTFSRETNLPSWGPTYNASDKGGYNDGGNETPVDPDANFGYRLPERPTFAYLNDRNEPGSYNRFLPNVLFTVSGTRQVSTSGTASVGDPLVRRFDLSKIDWLRFNGSKPTYFPSTDANGKPIDFAKAIRDNFGLMRIGGVGEGAAYGSQLAGYKRNGIVIGGAWVYVGHDRDPSCPNGMLVDGSRLPDPNSVNELPARILSLEEVARLGREPDFFELLQAVLLRGSLGLVTGSPMTNTGEFQRLNDDTAFNTGNARGIVTAPIGRVEETSRGFALINAQSKHQVMQIAANIIDQWDEDSFPTELRMGTKSFYGVENLPYVVAVGQSVLRPSIAAGADFTSARNPSMPTTNQYMDYAHGWLSFGFWNPHQNAAALDSLPNRPESMRVLVVAGKLKSTVHDDYKADRNSMGYFQGRDFKDPDTKPKNVTTFNNYPSGPAWIAFKPRDYGYFNEPRDLINSGYDHAYTSDMYNPGTDNLNNNSGVVRSQLGWKRAGIYLGWTRSPVNPFLLPPSAPLYGYVSGTKKPGTENAKIYNYEDFNNGSTYDASNGVPVLGNGRGPVIYYNHSAILKLNTTSGEYEASGGPMRVHLQYEDPESPGTWHTYQTLQGLTIDTEGRGNPWVEEHDTGVWTAKYKYYTEQVTLEDGKTKRWEWREVASESAMIDWPKRKVPPYYFYRTAVNNVNVNVMWDSRTVYDLVGNWASDQWCDVQEATAFYTSDPRTLRTNLFFGGNGFKTEASRLNYNYYKDEFRMDRIGNLAPHFFWDGVQGKAGILEKTLRFWVTNVNTNPTYYSDRDFVIRPGDYLNSSVSPLPPGDASAAVRPIMLNHRFSSIAELGYVFRDEPWKTLDLFSSRSGDAGVLDVFYIGDGKPAGSGSTSEVVAGKVNLNSAARSVARGTGTEVLAALISGGGKDFVSTNGVPVANGVFTSNEARSMARRVGEVIGGSNGTKGKILQNLGGLNEIVEAISVETKKTQREAVLRALTGSTQTRTWNLMVDVIAQAGRYGPGLASSDELNKFIVEGEKHYWLHVAIDRFTGKIIDQQLEPVME